MSDEAKRRVEIGATVIDRNGVRGTIEIAAGAGYQAVGKTDATGAFDVTVAAANVGDYSLQIGKRVTANIFAKSYQAAWGAVPVS